jgi:dTDP-4-dehydrorhamnose 3,5-epimerase-like enzyme
MLLSSADQIKLVTLPRHVRDDGELIVAEAATGVPFPIARLFVLRAPEGAVRGRHAHRRCSQFMLCLNGGVDVSLDDGTDQRHFVLDRSDQALLVPPMIWNTLTFRGSQSVMAVLCDRPYEAEDYIRDRAEFIDLRKGAVF